MKNLLLTSSLALVVLSSCETIVEVDTPPHTPRLALNYTLSSQPATPAYRDFFQVRELFVSGSQGVLDNKPLQGRKDATVQLFDESGQVVEQFRAKARSGYYGGYYGGYGQQDSTYGYYAPTRGFVGTPGRTYTLRATAPGLEPVESVLTLPALPTIETASYTAQSATNNGYGGYQGRLTVSIADNAATTDYYMAYGRVLDRNGRYWGRVQLDYNATSNNGSGPDVNLGRFQLSQAGSFYEQYPFSDAGGSGQRFTLNTDVLLIYDVQGAVPAVPEPAYIEVVVSSITPDMYRFSQSLLRYYDADGNPFAEPAPLYSNVRAGYGLFGGATDAVRRIAL